MSPLNAILAVFPESQKPDVEAYLHDYCFDHIFSGELNRKLLEKRNRRRRQVAWEEFLYVALRLCQPQLVLETGVFDGDSTAVILEALHHNKKGTLISIDLPATHKILGSTDKMSETTLPPDCQPGWAVPDYLRYRHELFLGDSTELLPKLLKEHPKIDVFLHDSLHTFDHMSFEYSAVWPHLSQGGLLLSDDIFWNTAFHLFCLQVGGTYVVVSGLGALRKKSSGPPDAQSRLCGDEIA